MHPVTRRIIDRTPSRLRPPVELTLRTTDAAMADRLPGLAAEIAFWVLLSLPALVLALIASLGSIGSRTGSLRRGEWQDQLIDRIAEVSRVALTNTTVDDFVRPVLEQLLEDGGVGLVSFGFLAAVWTASRAVKVVLTTLEIVYARDNGRPPWQERLLGFGVTIGALLLGAVLAPLLVAGPNFGEQLAAWIDEDLTALARVWAVAYWPAVVALATLAVATTYHLAVPGRTRWRHDLPGAVLATAVWLAGSGALRLYGSWSVTSQNVYGPLAGPIVGLLWLWVTGLAVLLGGELNALLEQRRRRPPRAVREVAPLGDKDVVAGAPATEEGARSGHDRTPGAGTGAAVTEDTASATDDGTSDPDVPMTRPPRG